MGFIDKIKNIISKNNSKSSEQSYNKRSYEKREKLEFFDEEVNDYITKYDHFSQNYSYYQNNTCPYCGCVLDKKINTSKKCPECKEKIIIRTNMYDKRRLLLKQDDLDDFEKYNNGIMEIVYYERLMKNSKYLYIDYMSKFRSYKHRGLSARDIIYSFSNYVACELDREAYNKYMRGIKKQYQDRVLECSDATLIFSKATQQYVHLYDVCDYKNKIDIALSTLADIANRDVQIEQLNVKSEWTRYSEQDFINSIHSGMIMKFLDKHNLTIDDFKTAFFKTNHPFILPLLENSDVWYYVEKALLNQKKYNDTIKNKQS